MIDPEADAEDPALGPEAEPSEEGRQVPRPRRLRPSEAARAWLDRQEASRRRKSVTIADPAEAIRIYRSVALGASDPSIKPTPLGERTEMEGSPIPLQVWSFVRATPGYDRWRLGFASDVDFEASIVRTWDLPKTFYAPLPTLCDAELEELARGRAEIERIVERECRGDEEGKLLPGMVRS